MNRDAAVGFIGAVLLVSSMVGVFAYAGTQATEYVPTDVVDEPRATALFAPPVTVSDTMPGSEPVIAVAPDGTLYYEGIGATEVEAGRTRNVNHVWRSTDGGKTWQDVTPPGIGKESSNDGFVAVGPDGSVFAANVFGLTFHLYRSTDRGETWTLLDAPRIPALMHRHWVIAHGNGFVQITFEALDPGAALGALAGGPSLEDLPGTPNRGFFYTESFDNGDSWTMPRQIDTAINYAGQSTMAVSEGGERVFIMRYEEPGRKPLEFTYETGSYYLIASEDRGATWSRIDAFPLVGTMGSALTSLTLDDTGLLSLVRAEAVNGTSRILIDSSRDGGRSWTRYVPEIGTGSQAMPIAVAAGPGNLSMVWYEADTGGLTGDIDAKWHVRYATVTGLDTAAPDAFATDISGTVHEGEICVAGPACRAREGDRRLLDYPWIARDSPGASHIAFASTMWDRPSAYPLYVGSVITDATRSP